ncbi:hypothetical protein [Sphingomonas sp. HMP6]|nr:hypothetical protein [Sphingomonas sp. HMP6]BCA60668.1 hypothetical protein HMP06_3437 [Sphingomonas sp. HMP6]
MTRISMLYAVFVLGVIALFTSAARDGFSPFADGGRRGIIHTAVGPNHK